MSTDSHPEESSTAPGIDQHTDLDRGPAAATFSDRPFLLHLAAAGVALVGAGLLQLHWPELRALIPQDRWWPADAGVLVAATAYLLSVAAVHLYAAWWPVEEPLQRRLLLGRELISALVVAVYFAIIIAQGPASTLLRAGLWRVPPLLLLSAAVSLLVLAAALWSIREARRRPSSNRLEATTPKDSDFRGSTGSRPGAGSRLSAVPTILVIGLLLALAALHRHQPDSRPSAAPPRAQQP